MLVESTAGSLASAGFCWVRLRCLPAVRCVPCCPASGSPTGGNWGIPGCAGCHLGCPGCCAFVSPWPCGAGTGLAGRRDRWQRLPAARAAGDLAGPVPFRVRLRARFGAFGSFVPGCSGRRLATPPLPAGCPYPERPAHRWPGAGWRCSPRSRSRLGAPREGLSLMKVFWYSFFLCRSPLLLLASESVKRPVLSMWMSRHSSEFVSGSL